MAENTKTLNTRIGLKIDTLENWNSSTLGLLKGEIAIATVAATAGTQLAEPVCMIKIGEDGVKTFSQLDWNFYAKASDVVSACKSEATLTAFINNAVTNADLKNNTDYKALVSSIETLNGDAETAGSVAKAIKDAIDALDLANTYAAKEHDHVAADITDLDTTIKAYDYATKTEAQGYADAKDEAIAAAQKAGDDAQDDVDALAAKVGTVADDTTVVEMIAAAQEAATYDDTALTGRVKATEDAITTLNSDATVAGSVDKKITDAINDFATKVTEGETIDTFKELVDYVGKHGGEAAEMASAISTLETKVGEKSVETQINEAIAAENLSQYATDDDVAGVIERVEALEGVDHEHANKALLDTYTQTEENLADAVAKKHSHANATVLDGITADQVTAWDAAEGNAKAYADEVLEAAKKYADDNDTDTTYTAAADGGLKLEGTAFSIDDSLTFIFDCGDSGVNA